MHGGNSQKWVIVYLPLNLLSRDIFANARLHYLFSDAWYAKQHIKRPLHEREVKNPKASRGASRLVWHGARLPCAYAEEVRAPRQRVRTFVLSSTRMLRPMSAMTPPVLRQTRRLGRSHIAVKQRNA